MGESVLKWGHKARWEIEWLCDDARNVKDVLENVWGEKRMLLVEEVCFDQKTINIKLLSCSEPVTDNALVR